MTYNEGDSTHNYINPFSLRFRIIFCCHIVSVSVCFKSAMYMRQVKLVFETIRNYSEDLNQFVLVYILVWC